MGLLNKAKTDSAAPVTREEFEALRGELAAQQKVLAIVAMCASEAIKNPALVSGSLAARFERIVHSPELFGLTDADLASARATIAHMDEARSAEYEREKAAERRLAEIRAYPWNSDGTYARRIPGT